MPVADLGDVFHDPNFRFPDGEVGNKLLVILAISKSNDYIIARTTSKPRAHSWTYGCHNDSVEPNFFIPKTLNLFHVDTWVCLDYLVDMDSFEFDEKVGNGSIHKLIKLPTNIFKAVIDCASRADDTSLMQEKVLRDVLARLP